MEQESADILEWVQKERDAAGVMPDMGLQTGQFTPLLCTSGVPGDATCPVNHVGLDGLGLPGATIDSHEGERVKGTIAIKFGPMSAAFAGAARLERDDAARRAVLRGAGQDSLSKSRTQGDITYRLEALSAGSTRVHVDMIYALQGPLAQFSRSGLVKDFVRRMVTDFGKQISRRLSGQAASVDEPQPTVSMAAMMWSVLWDRIRGWFGRSPRA